VAREDLYPGHILRHNHVYLERFQAGIAVSLTGKVQLRRRLREDFHDKNRIDEDADAMYGHILRATGYGEVGIHVAIVRGNPDCNAAKCPVRRIAQVASQGKVQVVCYALMLRRTPCPCNYHAVPVFALIFGGSLSPEVLIGRYRGLFRRSGYLTVLPWEGTPESGSSYVID
jgi:hypothetical protein